VPSRFHERPVVPAVSRPPVVDPVLSRQHALRAHRPDREVARESGGAREVVDSSLPPGGALNTRATRERRSRAWRFCAGGMSAGFSPSPARHLASTAASSIAIPAPCAANGSMAWAASPGSVTAPPSRSGSAVY